MKTIFLPDVYAGFQVMRWAERVHATIIRAQFNKHGGCKVCYLEQR